ncbi:MAG: prolyl oligopeptidase family serine peptidase [Flavobacteriaceae bacterium]
MKKIFSLMSVGLLLACQQNPKLSYPETEKIAVKDTYFETEVIDNYRWLEDDLSEATADWVTSQNDLTFGELEKIPFRNALKERLEKLWNYEKVGAPFKEGEYTYFYKNSGLQNQYVLYRYKESKDDTEVFLDPNTFAEDGTTSLAGLSFSDDGTLAAYAISEGGSDWRKVIVINAETREIIEDTLKNIKFSAINWLKNDGFFYSSYDKPEGSELSQKTDQHKLYYHPLGKAQENDVLVFGGTEEEKNRYVGAQVTDDGNYLLIAASTSTSGNQLFIKNLTKKNVPLVTVVDNYDNDHYLLENRGEELFLVTNYQAPNQRLVRVLASNPSIENWEDVIPHNEHVLSVSSGGQYFFAEYMIDAISQVYQYDFDGNNLGEVLLPGIGSIRGFSGKKEDETLFYNFANYASPSVIYRYMPKTQKSELFWEPPIDFSANDYVSTQVFYTSKDGSKVPMIITHKKGLKRNGKNPTILYGYGGFNISLTPSFSIQNAVWMEQGGIYAVPNLRGGGEYGKEWHNAGTKMQKQNVFDDFIAAAEYLIGENYTSSDYLAIRGGSNGGLLVGATMTQRPDLMKVALPAVGVLDMLRYHTFTAGAGWAYDYGTAEDSKEMFEYLKGYSPIHNVKEGVAYPATLITTGDHDDRVVPAHSFKFAAELQEKQQGENPVLIRIETKAGHGAGTPVSKRIEQAADIYGFTLYNMGFRVLPEKTYTKIKG